MLLSYCTVRCLFIATCVDAIGTVFWDRPKPNVLLQEKMDRNEKVTKFLKGLPEMPSTSCSLKSTLYQEENNSTTSDDPEDIQPVRSTSCELNYEEDFESCSNDPDAESGVYQFYF